MATQIAAKLDTRELLLPYVVLLIALCALLQGVIILAGDEIGWAATSSLIGVGLFALWNSFAHREQLSLIRFGRLVHHGATYLIVNLSYLVHASVLMLTDSPAIRGDTERVIDGAWFGVLIAMPTIWGLALLLHLLASVSNRGYEHIHAR